MRCHLPTRADAAPSATPSLMTSDSATSTHELLRQLVVLCDASSATRPEYGDASDVETVPTLDPSVRRPVTPMLRERFRFCGGWRLATHGDWLGIAEMELVASGDLTEPRISEIIAYKDAAALDWPNDACGLFRADRVSLFAGSDLTYTRAYLLWFDGASEPEVWAYDSNGEARYADLDAYLRAALNDDLSAYDKRWRLAES